jgi:hypothetical protein
MTARREWLHWSTTWLLIVAAVAQLDTPSIMFELCGNRVQPFALDGTAPDCEVLLLITCSLMYVFS